MPPELFSDQLCEAIADKIIAKMQRDGQMCFSLGEDDRRDLDRAQKTADVALFGSIISIGAIVVYILGNALM